MTSPYASYLRIVEELVALEEKNMEAPLVDEDRARWVVLTQSVFGPAEHDKRRHFRVKSSRPAKVLSPQVDPEAQVVSLSGGGLFVQTAVAAEVGAEIEVCIPFPPEAPTEHCFRAEVKWTSGRGQPEGTLRGVGLAFVDLNAAGRRAILALLREHLLTNLDLTLAKYGFFFRLSPDTTILVDHENRVIELNDEARRLLGRGDDELKGTNILEWVGRGSRPALADAIDSARESRRPARCELAISNAEKGAAVPVEVLVSPMATRDLDLGVLLAGRDLSERKLIEEQRRDLERRLYQADKLASLGQIAAVIAHDINNPLAWVLSNLTLLESFTEPIKTLVKAVEALGDGDAAGVPRPVREEIEAHLQPALDESLAGVRRIRSIIGDLKMFSRVEVMQEAEIDVNEAIETSLRMVRNQIEQRAHVVRDLGEVPRTWANFGKVSQVFLNLITNAARSFEHAGVETNEVRVRTWAEAGAIKASVGDNGRGIPEELQQKIFEPFFTKGSAEGGTGLGLTIVCDAVGALGGEIAVKSEVGKGTEFIVTLPVRPRPPGIARPRPSLAPPPGAPRPRLLVVDDELILLKAFVRRLSRRWEVVTATSGPEALEKVAEQSFDAILCDVMIPGMSGPFLYEKLQELHPGIEERVVFMTGGTFGEREREVLDALPNPIVEKPFEIREIEDVLRGVVDGGEIVG